MKHSIVFDLILVFGVVMIFLYLALGMLSEAEEQKPMINETPNLTESYNQTHMFDQEIVKSWTSVAIIALILGVLIVAGMFMSKIKRWL